MNREQKQLLAAGEVLRKLNPSGESQWLTETADSLLAISQAYETLKRVGKRGNRRPAPPGGSPISGAQQLLEASEDLDYVHKL